MKENKYDDDVFFNKYKEMNRSVQGLEGAGEWSQLKQLLPDFEGKRVLDLGCGYGWHCIYAAQQKAASVHGVDISKKCWQLRKKKAEITLSPINAAQWRICNSPRHPLMWLSALWHFIM